jgi:hypothetical protein
MIADVHICGARTVDVTLARRYTVDLFRETHG